MDSDGFFFRIYLKSMDKDEKASGKGFEGLIRLEIQRKGGGGLLRGS